MDKQTYNILSTISKDYYGVNYYDTKEAEAASKVILNKSPFRYYGDQLSYEVENFEKECSQYFGVMYAHAVNSATGGLSCALHALDITIGDEVIVPGFFWVAVANVLLLRGAIPVLCEIDESLNLDPKDLKRKITPRTKCVIVIHMDGVPADILQIRKICSDNHIKILEDFSQCIGGEIQNRKIGSFGDIAVASMQINKVITAGEGGILLTDNKDYYNKMVARSDFGFCREKNQVLDKGYQNYLTFGEGRRCNEITAAILRVQLRKLPFILKDMRSTKAHIKAKLGNIDPIQYRKSAYENEDIGTAFIMIFATNKDAVKFLQVYKQKFCNNDLKLYLLEEFGYHVYYNCTNLTEKKEALPGGFPWKFVNENIYNYKKGELPNTDNLLSRSVGMKLPAGLDIEQQEAVSEALRYLIHFL